MTPTDDILEKTKLWREEDPGYQGLRVEGEGRGGSTEDVQGSERTCVNCNGGTCYHTRVQTQGTHNPKIEA